MTQQLSIRYFQWKTDPAWDGTRVDLRLIAGGFAPDSSYSLDLDNFRLDQSPLTPEPSAPR